MDCLTTQHTLPLCTLSDPNPAIVVDVELPVVLEHNVSAGALAYTAPPARLVAAYGVNQTLDESHITNPVNVSQPGE